MVKFTIPDLITLRMFIPQVREEDKMEVRGMWGDNITLGVGASAVCSDECFMAWAEGRKPLALCGVAVDPLDPNVGHPWLLCTPHIKSHRIELLRHAKDSVRVWRKKFKTLLGYVHEDNHEAIRFIEALGFSIEPGTTYTFNNPLIRFRKFILCAYP